MHLGGFLVLIGVIFAALAALGGLPAVRTGNRAYAAPLLAIAVILIGIGVLVGNTQVH